MTVLEEKHVYVPAPPAPLLPELPPLVLPEPVPVPLPANVYGPRKQMFIIYYFFEKFPLRLTDTHLIILEWVLFQHIE